MRVVSIWTGVGAHAHVHPDARLKEGADAWLEHSGVKVCLQTISSSMKAIGWT